MDVVFLFRTLLLKKWLILSSALIAGLVTFFYVSQKPKIYRSTSQIATGYTVSDNIQIGNNNIDVYEADLKFNNAVSTINSQVVVSLLTYDMMLHDLQSKTPFKLLTQKQKQSKTFTEVNIEAAKKVFQAKLDSMKLLSTFKPEEKKLLEFQELYGYDYKTFSKQLTVSRLNRTDYIQIECYSQNPELSAYAINHLYQHFISYYRSLRGTISKESIDTLKSIMDKKKQDLDFKNALLRGGGVVDVGMQNTSNYDMISGFEQSLSAERKRLSDLNANLQKITFRLSTAPSAIKQPQSVEANTVNDELLELRRAMNNAYAAYINSGSNDKDLLAKYEQLKGEYQAKVSSLTRNNNPTPNTNSTKPTETREDLLQQKAEIEIDIRACNENITSLQSKIGLLKGNIYSGASKSAVIQTLTKEAEQANTEYIQAKQKYNDALDMSSAAANNFRQVLAAQPALAAEPSKLILLTLLAAASAMAVTVLIIVILLYLDSSLKTPVIFSKVVDLKLISTVNFMNLKNKSLNELVTLKDQTDFVRGKSGQNTFRESLRKLRYEIETSGKKIILFASTKKGQGKTTLIMGLAYILSMRKKRILIIDTNFSNNDLTVELGGQPVLEDLVFNSTGGAPVSEQIKALSKHTDNDLIYIIGSKGGDYTPSEVLPQDNILLHLKELKNEFDYVFLEGPPLNDFSDAKELSQYVEGVVGIFSATNEIKQVDKEAINYFKNLGEKYIGSILNKVDLMNMNLS